MKPTRPTVLRPAGTGLLEAFDATVTGVEAGRAAGMRVIAVAGTFDRAVLAGADHVVDDLDAIAAWFGVGAR